MRKCSVLWKCGCMWVCVTYLFETLNYLLNETLRCFRLFFFFFFVSQIHNRSLGEKKKEVGRRKVEDRSKKQWPSEPLLAPRILGFSTLRRNILKKCSRIHAEDKLCTYYTWLVNASLVKFSCTLLLFHFIDKIVDEIVLRSYWTLLFEIDLIVPRRLYSLDQCRNIDR